MMVISPAKTLDFESDSSMFNHTNGEFLGDAQKLIKEIKSLTKSDIANLMKLSDNLASINVDRYKSWNLPFTKNNSKQAIFAFKGDVYTGLETETLNKTQINFAQKHLRILSGLYGLMRPLDLMQRTD